MSPDRSGLADQQVGQLADPLLVGPADDEGPAAVVEQLLDGDDLAGDLARAGEDDVERLVEDDLAAPLEQLVAVEVGVQRHAHLAARRVDVDGAVVVVGEVACRRPTGGWVSLSTSSRRAAMCSRASRRV